MRSSAAPASVDATAPLISPSRPPLPLLPITSAALKALHSSNAQPAPAMACAASSSGSVGDEAAAALPSAASVAPNNIAGSAPARLAHQPAGNSARLKPTQNTGSSHGRSDAGAKRRASGALATKACHWKAKAPAAQANRNAPADTVFTRRSGLAVATVGTRAALPTRRAKARSAATMPSVTAARLNPESANGHSGSSDLSCSPTYGAAAPARPRPKLLIAIVIGCAGRTT